MTFPVAAPLVLWGNSFLSGELPGDVLVDHCGPSVLERLMPWRGRLLELVVIAPGDLSGLQTQARVNDSCAFLRSLDQVVMPDGQTFPATRSVLPTTRQEAERLLQQAFEEAVVAFGTKSPAFSLARPAVVAEFAFPDTTGPRERELFMRAATVNAIVAALSQSWLVSSSDQTPVGHVISALAHAARRAFEAACSPRL